MDAYWARGRDGQTIWVQPENDLIVVFTSSGPFYEWLIPMYIIPAILPTTTTTSTTPISPPPVDMQVIVLVAGVAVVVIVLEVFRRRR